MTDLPPKTPSSLPGELVTEATPALTGGCLCGRARYVAKTDQREGYYCHCRMCQLAFGNTRAAYLNVRKSEVEWLGQAMPAVCASSRIARRQAYGESAEPGLETVSRAPV